MKTIILTLVLFLSTTVFSQTVSVADTTKSVLLVSQFQKHERGLLSLFKQRNDVGVIINVNDSDVFIFVNGYCKYYGKIEKFDFDSTGHMHVHFNIVHKKGVGEVNLTGKLCYTVNDESFTMTIDGKSMTHTKIKYKLRKEKFFNVDFN
jgi:hypothetical protein